MSPTSIRLVVLGLSLSSSWGNGHATTYRALLEAFVARGHHVTFLERDVPWYAGAHRDLAAPAFCDLILYADRAELARHGDLIRDADAVIVGSYVPEGVAVGAWAQATAAGPVAFYDIDTPVTLGKLAAGEEDYLSAALIPRYDVYFSFSGGPILERIERRYGSPAARALYCAVDEAVYLPFDAPPRWDLSYLGTYSADRQPVLETLLIEPARRAPHLRFVVAGPLYPPGIDWPANVDRLEHVPPADHPGFYARSRYTLNVTRADMVEAGFSPSVRLFEAAACGTPIISDVWAGIETIFEPASEILLARTADDVLGMLTHPDERRRRRIGAAGRARVLLQHSAPRRAETLERELRAAILRRSSCHAVRGQDERRATPPPAPASVA
ncbi:MAG TPA: glycosyltransferase [Lichenihabitans sp.]|jgi:spore maturation protein CgeB|nr:glycosyltransferase [Lichenihabitans sp.]